MPAQSHNTFQCLMHKSLAFWLTALHSEWHPGVLFGWGFRGHTPCGNSLCIYLPATVVSVCGPTNPCFSVGMWSHHGYWSLLGGSEPLMQEFLSCRPWIGTFPLGNTVQLGSWNYRVGEGAAQGGWVSPSLQMSKGWTGGWWQGGDWSQLVLVVSEVFSNLNLNDSWNWGGNLG